MHQRQQSAMTKTYINAHANRLRAFFISLFLLRQRVCNFVRRPVASCSSLFRLVAASVLSSLLSAITNLDAVQIAARIFATVVDVADMQTRVDALDAAAKDLEERQKRIEDSVNFLSAGLKITASLSKGDVAGAAQTALAVLQ